MPANIDSLRQHPPGRGQLFRFVGDQRIDDSLIWKKLVSSLLDVSKIPKHCPERWLPPPGYGASCRFGSADATRVVAVFVPAVPGSEWWIEGE